MPNLFTRTLFASPSKQSMALVRCGNRSKNFSFSAFHHFHLFHLLSLSLSCCKMKGCTIKIKWKCYWFERNMHLCCRETGTLLVWVPRAGRRYFGVAPSMLQFLETCFAKFTAHRLTCLQWPVASTNEQGPLDPTAKERKDHKIGINQRLEL